MSQPVLYEPRLCHVVKRADFDGYGFNLHAEKGKPGQYIGKVDDASPAESAGLRQGDRILEVNGQNISSETHKQVVERIKLVANHTTLLVIDPKADIHNHQQINIIEKARKEAEVKSNENNNNNGKTNGNSASEKLIMEEMKREVENLELKLEKEENGNGHSSANGSTNGSITNGSITPPPNSKLNLSMTAAEMRAYLKNKKRPDPKSEGIDVRKKYEIIQKM